MNKTKTIFSIIFLLSLLHQHTMGKDIYNVTLKNESLQINKSRFHICEDTIQIKKIIDRIYSDGDKLKANIKKCMTFYDIWFLFHFLEYFGTDKILLSYRKTNYELLNSNINIEANNKLRHTIIVSKKIITEGKAGGFGEKIKRKNLKRDINVFLETIKNTKNNNSSLLDHKETIIAFEKDEEASTVFYFCDKFIENNLKDIKLALIRGEKDYNNKKCYDELIHSSLFINKSLNYGSKFGVSGCRTKKNISDIVTKNLSYLNILYDKWLKNKPEFKCKLTVKFAIDKYGNVINYKKLSSTMNNVDFEKEVKEMIIKWEFGAIDKPGDITEVVYPFIFSK